MDPDEEAGMEGQKKVLEALDSRLMPNMDPLYKVGWVGPRPPAGTRLNAVEARRTRAYVVPKKAVDRLLQPQFESMLADKDPEVNKVCQSRVALTRIFNTDTTKRRLCISSFPGRQGPDFWVRLREAQKGVGADGIHGGVGRQQPR